MNVSLKNSDQMGTKVEIKNLNSFKAVEKSLEYEIERQAKALEAGEKIIQETRGWDDAKGVTFSQREKEEAHDYRYFPEPDLPPLHFTKEQIQKIKAEVPELPGQKRERFSNEYGLDEKTIGIFIFNKDLGEYYEKVTSELRNWVKESETKEKVSEGEFLKLAKLCSNYIITDLQGLLKGDSISEQFIIKPENFAEFITLIYEGQISSKTAKIVLDEMLKKGADPTHIIQERGLVQTSNEEEIAGIAKEIIDSNPKAVEDYKGGKEENNVGQGLVPCRFSDNHKGCPYIFLLLCLEGPEQS